MTHVFAENHARGTKCRDYVKTLTKIDLIAKSDPRRIIPYIETSQMENDPKPFRKARYAEM
jgi:hypothetical protein